LNQQNHHDREIKDPESAEKYRKRKAENAKTYRERKKQKMIETSSGDDSFKSMSGLTKAAKRVEKALPVNKKKLKKL
jgi:uncharacterized surface protein with fasciclin (FAS1) repeats